MVSWNPTETPRALRDDRWQDVPGDRPGAVPEYAGSTNPGTGLVVNARQLCWRAERLSAKTRRSSTAPCPSAAELTRREKSSETTMPV